MNTLVKAIVEDNNIKIGENGDKSYRSTMSGIMDLFAFGASFRTRSEEECIFLFKKAFEEDRLLALKCLFYLRDIRGGQGERRFFRVIIKWLAQNYSEMVIRNLEFIPFFGRWDDLYALVGTPVEKKAFDLMREQLTFDLKSENPSLLAKWLKSENTKSCKELGSKTRKAFSMTPREYRKTLSYLRKKIRTIESLMSRNLWEEIEFDKIPSKAGIKYRKALSRHEIIGDKYKNFMLDTTKKVNADTLNPCDVVHEVDKFLYEKIYQRKIDIQDTERLAINKYWDNLKDYFNGAVFNGVAVVDTSGSMLIKPIGCSISPIDAAIALGMYCAEKCSSKSPWHGHYISFSRKARLVPVEGIDFFDKVVRIAEANVCDNTNIEDVFDLILKTAIKNNVRQEDMPDNIIIISDMEFDEATNDTDQGSVVESCLTKYRKAGYVLPALIFWNVSARNNTIAVRDYDNITFISGYSPVIFEQILSGKKGIDLILDKLNSERYSVIK